MITYLKNGPIKEVEAEGKCEQRNLPAEYTQLEYIESTGTQYIDTGILLSNTDVFEITFQSLNTLETSIMGAISGGTLFTSADNLSVTYNTATTLLSYSVYCNGAAGNQNGAWNGGNATDGLKHTIKYNGLNIAPIIDGVAMAQITSTTLVANNPTVTTWLFGRNNTSTGNLSQAGVRIYDVYIQGKGHFIPCKRNSDNVLGMYDTVTGNFLTNAGTGRFTAGPDVVPTPDTPMDIVCNNGVLKVRHLSGLPLGYTLLEYIESSATLYIDTGLKASSNTRILAQYKLTMVSFTFPISARNSANAGAGFSVGVNGSNQFISDYNGNRQIFTTITPNTTDIITVDKNKNVCTISIGGQSETVTNTASTFTTINTLPLFAQNTNGSISSGRYTFYSFKMWDGDTLVRDMVPAKYGDTVGMYDLADPNPATAFHTNQGTGEFIAGADIDDIEIYADGTTETVKVTGDNLFDIGTATTEMLLSVGKYKDKLYILDGTVNRNVGVKVLDGTEDWVESSTVGKFNAQHLLDGTDGRIMQNIRCFCTHFLGVVPSTPLTDMKNLTCKAGWVNGTTNNDSLYVAYAKYENNLVGFKQYLADQYAAGTPVIIVYLLAKTTTEYVTPQISNPDNKDITATVIDGSLDDLVVNIIDYIPYVKKRYVTDDAGNLTEVKKVYKGNLLVYSK